MKRYKSTDVEFEAWVEIPDEWTVGHYDIYSRANWEAQVEHRMMPNVARLVGVLTLARKGAVAFDVPGVVVSDDEVDVTGIGARAMGFLMRTVAFPLEATQQVPFERVEPSTNGTPETTKAKRNK